MDDAASVQQDSGEDAVTDEQTERCSKLVATALERCPRVRELQQALERLGTKVPIDCVACPEGPDGNPAAAGGFLPDTNSVVLCQQWVTANPPEVPNTLTHELVHAYDHARATINWLNLTHHACTEIRAATLSGDCTFGREIDRANINPLKIGAAGERCIRRRAQLSVAMNPTCKSKGAAVAAVDRAWKICSVDYAPFDRAV